MHAGMAFNEEGKILAIRCQTTSSMGAYHTGGAAIIPTKGGTRLLTNVYRIDTLYACLLYTSPSPRDLSTSRMPSSA